jgi:acyl carrier protein
LTADPSRQKARGMFRRKESAHARNAAVVALRGVVIDGLADPEALQRLADPKADVTFDELGLDSLALLTVAAALDGDFGYAVTEEDLESASSVKGLVRLLTRMTPSE